MDKYPGILDKLQDKFRRTEVKRKTCLVRQGEVSRFVYFVESGCLRLWHNYEGNDVTVEFFQSGDVVGPFECIFWNQPAEMELEAIIPSVVKTVEKDDLLNVIFETPESSRFVIDKLLRRLSDYKHRVTSIIKTNPATRYEELEKEKPELVALVPDHYIASYLGITPVSLSRIRKKLQKH